MTKAVHHQVDEKVRPLAVRLESRLDGLADALARRGISVERRDTDTFTNFETVTETTTITETETETDWTTEWGTEIDVETVTVTTFDEAKTTETATETVTKHVSSSAAPGEEGGDDGSGTSKGTIIGASVGGAVGGILFVALIAFCLWRRRKNNKAGGNPAMLAAAGTDGHGHQTYIADNNGGSKTMSTVSPSAGTPEHAAMMGYAGHNGERGWSPSHPPSYGAPPSHEMPSSPVGQYANIANAPPQQGYWGYSHEMPAGRMAEPPQELYNHQYMSGLGLAEMREQRR